MIVIDYVYPNVSCIKSSQILVCQFLGCSMLHQDVDVKCRELETLKDAFCQPRSCAALDRPNRVFMHRILQNVRLLVYTYIYDTHKV